MDFSLDIKTLEHYKRLPVPGYINEFSAEAVVPDTQEDIARVLTGVCTPLVHIKDVGGGRVNLSGDVAVTVLYIPESQSGTASLDLKIPFTAGFETGDGALPVTGVTVLGLEVSLLNPRKIQAVAEVRVDADCYVKDSLSWGAGIKETAAELHVRKRTANFKTVSSVMEKTFTVSEELAMPPGKPSPGKILACTARLRIDDAQDVGTRLIIKGAVLSGVSYVPKDGAGLEYAAFETPFSQLMDLPEEKPAGFYVTPMLTQAYADVTENDSGSGINLEVHGAAQTVYLRESELEYIDDAYSTLGELDAEYGSLQSETPLCAAPVHTSQHWTTELSRPASQVVMTGIIPGAAEYSEGTISFPVTADIVYTGDDGNIYGERARLKCECPWEGGDPGRITAVAGEAAATASGISADLRCQVDIYSFACEKSSVNAISSLAQSDEKLYKTPRPSVTVVRCDSDDLWSAAKKYRSDPEKIAACSGIEDGESAYGRVLLIPKC